MSKQGWRVRLGQLLAAVIDLLARLRGRIVGETVVSQPTAQASQVWRRLTREDVVAMLAERPSRQIDLSNATLSQADLSNLDLTGANFANSSLRLTNLSGCLLKDANFADTYCAGADFSYCDLTRSDFSNAYLRATTFSHAGLYRAKMDGADFHGADLSGTNLYRTSFINAKRLYAEAVGPNIIQDKKTTQEQFFRWLLFEKQQRAPEMAAKRLAEFSNNRLRQGEYIYRNLKTLFLNNGRYADASWAYVRERRTRRKMHAPTVASHYFRTSYPAEGRLRHIRRVWFYAKHLFLWLVDWLAELSCGYGERPLNTIILAFASLIIFPFIYATTGGIDGATTCLDYFNYSLATFTTIGFSQFTAITPLSQTLTSLEALLGIALLALLMFVLGNRISKA